MRWIYNHILPAVAAVLITVCVYWYFEPYPYSYVDVSVDSANQPVSPGGPVPIHIKLFRTGLCPYILERRIYGGIGDKVTDQRLDFSTPDTLGEVDFTAPTPVINAPMAPGVGSYEARIGARCNPLQFILPNYGPWYSTTFKVG